MHFCRELANVAQYTFFAYFFTSKTVVVEFLDKYHVWVVSVLSDH